jgi:hypothetical protein
MGYLVGNNLKPTLTETVPIVTALIKVKTSSTGEYLVLLKIHKTPYIQNSPVTLLSEYQIRDYGLVIDSVVSRHYASPGRRVHKGLTLD